MNLPLYAFYGLAISAAHAFAERGIQSTAVLQMSAIENQRFDRIQRVSVGGQVKLIVMDDSLLSGNMRQIELFDGSAVKFKITKNQSDPIWKGKEKNFNRFVIRRVGKRYSGHFLYKGRQYVLAPIKDGASLLYETETNHGCGMGMKEKGFQ
jgi:hypothetical protein